MDAVLIADLLKFGEQDWLEYKSELHFVLEHHDNAHADWEKGKGVLPESLTESMRTSPSKVFSC